MDVPSKCIAALIVALTVFVVGCGREEEVLGPAGCYDIYSKRCGSPYLPRMGWADKRFV